MVDIVILTIEHDTSRLTHHGPDVADNRLLHWLGQWNIDHWPHHRENIEEELFAAGYHLQAVLHFYGGAGIDQWVYTREKGAEEHNGE